MSIKNREVRKRVENRRKKPQKNKGNKYEIFANMIDIVSVTLIITLNVSGLNIPVKRGREAFAFFSYNSYKENPPYFNIWHKLHPHLTLPTVIQ